MVLRMGNRFKIAELIRKGKLSIGDGYRAKNSELSPTGLPFVRAGNLNNGFYFEDADCFPIEDLAKVGEKISRPGDVVFTSKGTVGRFAYVNDETPRFVYSPQLCYWRSLDWNFIVPRYLYYWINSQEFWVQAASVKGQTDMADYVSLTDQRRMTITLHPIKEQHAIADTLGALDDKIELNRQMNRTLEQMAQALFKSWFVDFDPVVARAAGKKPHDMSDEIAALFPNKFVDSELGPIPEGWKVVSVQDLARYVNGKNFTKNSTGTGSLVIRIAELNSGPSPSTKYNNVEAGLDNIAKPGDLLFSWSGSLNVYRWYLEEALINQHIFKVIPNGFPQWFVHLALIDSMPFFQSIAANKATTMGHVKREHLSQWKIAVPDHRILDAADNLLSDQYYLSLLNERESLSLAELRDTLLPKLLSGQIRIKRAEKLVSEVP